MARKPRITSRALDEAAQIAAGVAPILDVLACRIHDDPELSAAFLMVDRTATRLRQRAAAAALAEIDMQTQEPEA